MATLLELQAAITDISKNHYILDDSSILITARINDAVKEIAGGILLAGGRISPPLPQLYETAVVATHITLPYVILPDNYQRDLFHVQGSTGRVSPPDNSDYYGFDKFIDSATNINGSGDIIRMACVKGLRLYYQAIPSASVDLTVMYYRKPVAMVQTTDVVDGIPDQFQTRLIKHYIGRQLAYEMVSGTEKLALYHNVEFESAMADMVEFIDRKPKKDKQ